MHCRLDSVKLHYTDYNECIYTIYMHCRLDSVKLHYTDYNKCIYIQYTCTVD